MRHMLLAVNPLLLSARLSGSWPLRLTGRGVRACAARASGVCSNGHGAALVSGAGFKSARERRCAHAGMVRLSTWG